MRKVAVLGGGPAGAFAAEKLARSGIETMLIDEKLAWEKPCGGGITYKAYEKYRFLKDNDTPKHLVTDTCVAAPRAGSARMTLRQPLLIYSRYDLNHLMLQRARDSGAQVEKTRVLELKRQQGRWRLRTRDGDLEADYCIVATGARNPLRDVGTQLRPADAMIALGYYVPANQQHIDIQFLPQLEGYIWVFPRCGHLSVGICGKGEPAQKLRLRLEQYMREKEIDYKNAQFYSHLLPSLETPAWRSNRIAGDGWMAVGDAGGLVDPITGEGLYYAMRSAELATDAILEDRHPMAELSGAYRRVLEHDFGDDLAFGASIARRVFLGRFLFRAVPTRMVEFMKRSPLFLELMQDLFAGTQPYLTLRSRLLQNLNGTLQEILMNAFVQRILPGGQRA
ncbi:MAG TPA: NAD(P)/FAD-dependent oxidoreductase [Bryobacteraceae bacterium]|nr:NAD(P)/FAD-dependent oxidoreductase [Bryobacteraceae bacterium]